MHAQTDQPLLPVSVLLDSGSITTLTQGRALYKWLCYSVSLAITLLLTFVVYQVAADKPIERSFTAAMSLSVSIAIFVWFACKWNTLPIAFQYCLRGATLGILVPIILESWSQSELPANPEALSLTMMMLAVGFSEEGGKLLALLLFTSLSASSLRSPDGCCSTLVLKPRMLVFLGICVGFGFMITENVEYFLMIDTINDPNESQTAQRIGRILTGLLRSFLNLHPLLTGLVAARLAKRIYTHQPTVSQGPDSSRQQVSTVLLATPVNENTKIETHVGDWMHALWWPSIIHGGFDLAVTVLGVFGEVGEYLSLAVVGGVWYWCYKQLTSSYLNLGE